MPPDGLGGSALWERCQKSLCGGNDLGGWMSASAYRVVAEDLRHAARELLRRRQVQELVRAVGVRAWAEDAGDHEFGVRVALAEHRHERDRPALAHVDALLAEERPRGAGDRLLEPGAHRRRVPPGAPLEALEGHAGAVGRVARDRLL